MASATLALGPKCQDLERSVGNANVQPREERGNFKTDHEIEDLNAWEGGWMAQLVRT